MSDVVDFKIVSDNGLTDSSLSASLAGFRAGKAKYFSRKYHSQYVSFSPDEKKREISHFNQILLEERQLIFDSPIIAVVLYEDADVFWPEFYYQNGMVLNLLYEKHGQDGKIPKRAVGIVLVEGAAIPDALVGKFKFAHQRSKLAGDVRGTYFVVKQNWDELLFGGKNL